MACTVASTVASCMAIAPSPNVSGVAVFRRGGRSQQQVVDTFVLLAYNQPLERVLVLINYRLDRIQLKHGSVPFDFAVRTQLSNRFVERDSRRCL